MKAIKQELHNYNSKWAAEIATKTGYTSTYVRQIMNEDRKNIAVVNACLTLVRRYRRDKKRKLKAQNK